MGKGSKRKLAMKQQVKEEEALSMISFAAKEIDLVQWEGDLIAVGVTERDLIKDENSKFQNSILAILDSLLGGLLADATKEAFFIGICGEKVLFELENHSFDKVGLIGLGQGDSTRSAYSSFGEHIVATAKYTQAKNIGVVLASSEGIPDESKFVAASAITYGIKLGIREDSRSQSRSKKLILWTVDIHGLGAELENKLTYADLMSNCLATTSVHVHHKAQNPPTTVFSSCSRERKFTSTQGNTGPPSEKRGKFVEEKNTTREEGQTEQPQEEFHSFHIALVPSAPNEVSSFAHTLSGAAMGLTEIVGMAAMDTEDEVVSSSNPALVTIVDGYRVKTEYASRIRSIFRKHGNIAEKGPQSRMFCAWLLEKVCDYIERLENQTFKKITTEELKDMLEDVAEIKSHGIQVQWLLQKLTDINEAKTMYTEASSIKLSLTCIKKDVESTKHEVLLDGMMLSAKQDVVEKMKKEVEKMKEKIQELQGKIGAVQHEMVPLKEKLNLSKEKLAGLMIKSEENKAVAADATKKISRFLHKSLVEGLL